MIRPADISEKSFHKSFFGYDMEQVDAFLDEIIDTLIKTDEERREMAEIIDRLSAMIEERLYPQESTAEAPIVPELPDEPTKTENGNG